ncbi:UNVERIFIED_CONTAM: hypothetical protein Sangu_1720800 [Sesamum angustifolium]|uniref:Uncharacterized protein n=1 Tax=Sesamum angustifolium TaxID=2727405 RepID=A0AAW2MLS9_9LAMI
MNVLINSLVERFIVGNTQQIKACGICTSSGHASDACPMLQEEPTMHANAVGGFFGPSQRGHDPFSNAYGPRWRDHLNLRYGNQPQNFQRHQQLQPPPQTNSNSGTSLEDMLKTLIANTQQFQQDTRASIQNLEFQVSQLVSSVCRLESQVKMSYNSKLVLGMGTHNRVKQRIQLSVGTQNRAKQGGIPLKQAEKSDLIHEKHPKVFVPKPPFPERFAKSKKEEDEREIVETLRQVEVNIPLLD